MNYVNATALRAGGTSGRDDDAAASAAETSTVIAVLVFLAICIVYVLCGPKRDRSRLLLH